MAPRNRCNLANLFTYILPYKVNF